MALDFKLVQGKVNSAFAKIGTQVKVTRAGASVGTGYGLFVANTTKLESSGSFQTGLSTRTLKLAINKAPEIGDIVVVDKQTFTVTGVETVRPTTTTLLYTLELT